MLMPGSGKAARVHYLPGTFRLLTDGDHVVCAVTGERIPLHELRYWSVERQEPYSTPKRASRPSSGRQALADPLHPESRLPFTLDEECAERAAVNDDLVALSRPEP